MKLCPKKLAAATARAAAVVFQMHTSCTFANNPQAADDSIGWASLLLPTVLILAAAAAATFLLKRWKGAVGGHNGPLQLVHVVALGPRERLALVKVGARYLVVGITPNNVNRIAELYDIQHADAGSSQVPPDGNSTDAGV